MNLRADGEQVRCTAPRGVLTPSLREEIARRKLEILLHLRHRPLSFGEESLWFLQQLQGDRADYNLSIAARLRGALDPASLARSLEVVARRHDMLRTTFMAVDGQPFRIIAADPIVTLPLIDLGASPADVREAELHRLAATETRRPFDLARGPCWRTLLVRLDERDHVLIVAKHQSVSDGWSTQVFFRELNVAPPDIELGEKAPITVVNSVNPYRSARRSRATGSMRCSPTGAGGSRAPRRLSISPPTTREASSRRATTAGRHSRYPTRSQARCACSAATRV